MNHNQTNFIGERVQQPRMGPTRTAPYFQNQYQEAIKSFGLFVVSPKYHRKTSEDSGRYAEQVIESRPKKDHPSLYNDRYFYKPVSNTCKRVCLTKPSLNAIYNQTPFNNCIDKKSAEEVVKQQQAIKPAYPLYAPPPRPMNPEAKPFVPSGPILDLRPQVFEDDDDSQIQIDQALADEEWRNMNAQFYGEMMTAQSGRFEKFSSYFFNKDGSPNDLVIDPSDEKEIEEEEEEEEEEEGEIGDYESATDEGVTVEDYYSEEEEILVEKREWIPKTTQSVPTPKVEEKPKNQEKNKPENDTRGSWWSRFTPQVNVVHDLSDDVKKRLDTVGIKVQEMKDSVVSMTKGVKEIVDRLLKSVASPSVIDKVLMCIIAILNIARAKSFTDRVLIFTQALLGLGLSITDRLLQAGTAFCGYLAKKVVPHVMKAQSGDENKDAAKIIHAGVTDVLEQITEEKHKETARIAMKAFSFAVLARQLGSIKNAIQAIEILCKYVLMAFSYVYERVTGHPYPTEENKEIIDEAITWMKEVRVFVEQSKNPDFANEVEWNKMCWAGYMTGLEISTRVQKVGYKHSNFGAFFKTLDLLKPYAMLAKDFLGVACQRVLPVWVELAGDPGVGKSMLMSEIIRGLYFAYCQKLGAKFNDNIESMRYNHSPGVKFFDTYRNQFCFVMDDWDQKDDEDERTDNSFHIIRAHSPAAYVLPAADISNIGFKFFDSKLILTTSNIIANGRMKNLKYKLISMDALNRRCDFFVETLLVDKFSKRCEVREPNSSHSKFVLNPDFTKCKDIRLMYKFRLWNRRTQKPYDDFLTYQELLDKIWAKMSSNLKQMSGESSLPKYETPLLPSEFAHLDKNVKVTMKIPKTRSPQVPRETYVPKQPPLYQAQSGESVLDMIKDMDNKNETEVETGTKLMSRQIPVNNLTGKPKLFKLSKGSAFRKWFERECEHAQHDGKTYVRFENVVYYVHEDVDFTGFRPVNFDTSSVRFEKVGEDKGKKPKTRWQQLVDYVKSWEPEIQMMFGYVILPAMLVGLQIAIAVGSYILMLLAIMKVLGFIGLLEKPAKAQHGTVIEHTSAGGNAVFPQKQNLAPRKGQFVSQSGQSTDSVIEACSGNSFRMWLTPNDPSMSKSRFHSGCQSFGGRILLMPKHFVYPYVKEVDNGVLVIDCKMTLYNKRHGIQQFDLTDTKNLVVLDRNNDRAAFYLPDMKLCKDIRHHLITETDLRSCDLSDIVIAGVPHVSPGSDYSLDKRYCSNARLLSNVKYYDDHGQEYHNAEIIAYNVPNYNGMCYYVIYVNNDKVKGKILGFHGAGNSDSNTGLGLLNDRASVEDIYAFFKSKLTAQSGSEEKDLAFETYCIPLEEDPKKYVFDDTKFRLLGTVPQRIYNRLAKESEITSVPFPGIVGPITRHPANFAPHDNIKPIQNSLDLFGVTPESFDNVLSDEDIQLAWRSVLNNIQDKVPWDALSLHQAINGVPTYRHGGQLDMTTAGGANMTTLEKPVPCTNKLYKFDWDLDKDGKKVNFRMKPETKLRYDEISHNYALGMRGVSPVVIKGKDELRSKSKVDLPRLFSVHEAEQTVLGRKYFGPFIENILESRDSMGITLGINPFNPAEWTWVLRGHKIADPLFQVGDTAHADKNRNARVSLIGNETICEYLRFKGTIKTEEDMEICRGLLSDISCTIVAILEKWAFHILGYQFSSGSFITAIMQSLYYKVNFYLAFMSANKRFRMMDEEEKWKYLIEVCQTHLTPDQVNLVSGFPQSHQVMDRKNGDDFINIISSDYAWFTCHCLKYELSTMNVDITPALKETSFKSFYETNEIDFLKRVFRYIEVEMRAPLDINVIFDVFNWDSATSLPKDIYYKQKAEWACLELVQWGKDVYEDVTARINEFMKWHGVSYVCPLYRTSYWKWKDQLAPGTVVYRYEAQSGKEEVSDEESSEEEDDFEFLNPMVNMDLHDLFELLKFTTETETKAVSMPAAFQTEFQKAVDKYSNTSGDYCVSLKPLFNKDPIQVSIAWIRHADGYYTAFVALSNTETMEISRIIGVTFNEQDLALAKLPADIAYSADFEPFGMDILEENCDADTVLCYINRDNDRIVLTIETSYWGLSDFTLSVPIPPLIYDQLFLNEDIVFKAQSGVEITGNGLDSSPSQSTKTITFTSNLEMSQPNQSSATLGPKQGKEEKLFLDIPAMPFKRTGRVFRKQNGTAFFKPRTMSPVVVIRNNQVYELNDIEEVPFRAQSGIEMQETKPVETEQKQLTATVVDNEVQDAGNGRGYLHFYRNVDPMPDQGLTQILSRKYRIATFTWSGAFAKNSQVFKANFPKALLDVANNLQEKINRFHYFRAHVELEFHVAGTMYHYGTLMAAVLPFTKGENNNPRLANIWRMSTCDHVLISPDANTTTKIMIPFMGQQSYWRHDLVNDEGYFGEVLISVLFPLKVQNATSTPSIPVTIFASFVNPEVMGPTLHAQSGMDDLTAMAVTSDREQVAKSKSGIVSKSLDFASRLASACVMIPGVGSVAGVAASGLFFGARMAKYFGFDKPDNISKFQPVYLTTANAMATGNGMNTVNTLTMDVENKISNQPEDFQAKTCETDISHLVSMPGLFLDGVFDTSAIAGTVIAKWHNSPYIAPATASVVQYIPCSAVASQFSFWSGDMKYLLMFKCSKFHVCKVRIAYHPTFDEIVLTPEGEGDFPSVVIDVCGDTTFEFKIPYLFNEPYCTAHDPTNPVWDRGTYAGAISISIVNPIATVPGTVDDDIYFCVYAAADPHMDFQAPNEPDASNHPGKKCFIIKDGSVTFAPPFIAQSAKENTCIPQQLFNKDFGYLFPATGRVFKRVATGEENRSILDLLHRFQRTDNLNLSNGTTYKYRYPQQYNDGTYVSTNNLAFEFFREWFYFARGGLEYKVTHRGDSTSGAMVDGTLLCRNLFDNSTYLSPANMEYGRIGTVLENFHYKPSLEISIGHYSKYPYWWRENDYPTEFRGSQIYNTFNGIQFEYKGIDYMTFNGTIWMAARDDTHFGYPRGCPMIFWYPEDLSDDNNSLKTVKSNKKNKT